MLNLSRIPKDLVIDTKNGEKAIYIDVLENRNGADQYGNTHTITVYNPATKEKAYIANLKEQEFGVKAAPAAKESDEDLPDFLR